MTTSNENHMIENTTNPFLTEELFAQLKKLTDPLDALVLASDALAALEYVAACAHAQQGGTPTPELPKFQSMFCRDLTVVAEHWLGRCLKFAAKDWKRAEAELRQLRADRMIATDDTWTDAEVREFFEGVMRAAKAKAEAKAVH